MAFNSGKNFDFNNLKGLYRYASSYENSVLVAAQAVLPVRELGNPRHAGDRLRNFVIG